MRLASLTLALLLLANSAPATAESTAEVSPQEQLYLQALRALTERRPDEASVLLMRFLANEPEHAGAWLDLAISQCEQGNVAYAERLFENIVQRFAPPPGILEVIAQQRAQGCKPDVPAAQYAISIAMGHDSNVNQGASNPFFNTNVGGVPTILPLDPEFLPKPDAYRQLVAEYSSAIRQTSTTGFVQLRVRQHAHIQEQDSAAALVGLDQAWQIGSWRGGGTAAYSWLQLNERAYLRQTQAQLRASPPITLPSSLEWSINAGLNRISYPSRLNDDATTVELGNKLQFQGTRYKGGASLAVLIDRGPARRLGGDRKGWYSSASLYLLLSDQLRGQLGFSQQTWLGSTAYAPGSIDVVRRQDLMQLNAALIWPMTRAHSLQLEWRGVRNRENISLLQYKSRTIQLSWRWDL